MFINSKLTYGLLILLAISIATAGIQTIRFANEQKNHAETIAHNESEWTLQYKTSADAAKDSLAIYTNQTEALQKEAEDAKKQRDKANAHAIANANTGKLLREKLALARSCTAKTESATVTSGSETTGAAVNLFDYVQRRLDEASDGIAKYADEAGIAGRACEKSYYTVSGTTQ